MDCMDLARVISALAPGQCYSIDRGELNLAAHSARLAGQMGPVWSPAERIMEAIVGSAYEFRFWEDHAAKTVVFERLQQPLDDGRRSYVSPDRVDLFARTPDGFYKAIG